MKLFVHLVCPCVVLSAAACNLCLLAGSRGGGAAGGLLARLRRHRAGGQQWLGCASCLDGALLEQACTWYCAGCARSCRSNRCPANALALPPQVAEVAGGPEALAPKLDKAAQLRFQGRSLAQALEAVERELA